MVLRSLRVDSRILCSIALTIRHDCLITARTVLLLVITKDLRYLLTDLTGDVILWLKLRFLLI